MHYDGCIAQGHDASATRKGNRVNMKIQLKRVYEIKGDMTAAAFIALVDREYMHKNNTDIGLDCLDMGDAVAAATDLFDAGHLTHLVDIVDYEYHYIDCPDKSTQLSYHPVHGYTLIPGFQSPYEAIREKILQGRSVIMCHGCREGNPCYDDGSYSGWICPSKLHQLITDHFAGRDISITNIAGTGVVLADRISIPGWRPTPND